MQKTNNKRILWLDALRGIAMLFVIFGHQCKGFTEYYVFTSPIKIPLFFAITGFVFNDRDGNIRKFFRNLFLKLFIPWVLLSLVPARIIYSLLGFSSKSVGTQIYDFLSGSYLWYMPCCIIAEIIQFFVRKYMKKGYLKYSACIILMIAGVILANNGIGDFANINTAFIAQGFIAIGLFIKGYVDRLDPRRKRNVLICGAVVYILLCVFSLYKYPGKTMDVHLNRYYSYTLCGMQIFSGLISLFLLFEFIQNFLASYMRFVTYIGQNTLVFYMVNPYVIQGFRKVLSMAKIDPNGRPIFWFINTIVACLGCGFAAFILNKFFPFAVGKSKK